MATKYELYQAHPAKDPFDIEPAILHLEQASKWLQQAMELAKQGSISSLLEYYQVGYTSGNWHFPTIATHYAHGIGHRLAKMLADELFAGTQFYFKYPNNGPQTFSVYYSTPDAKHEELLVATIAIWSREIYIALDVEREFQRLDDLIEKRRQKIKEEESFPETFRKDVRRVMRRRPWSWMRKRAILARSEELIQHHIKSIPYYEADIKGFESRKQHMAELQQQLPVLNSFEKYRFTLVTEAD